MQMMQQMMQGGQFGNNPFQQWTQLIMPFICDHLFNNIEI